MATQHTYLGVLPLCQALLWHSTADLPVCLFVSACLLQLSAIDASPFLLRTLNCPSLKFSHDLRLDKLKQATAALLQEYPILGGR